MRVLVDLAEGAILAADDRLAPGGMELDRHYVHVAATLARAESLLGRLDDAPSPFGGGGREARVTEARYQVIEAALAYWGLAVRLRSRITGAHASHAAEPLRRGLRALAADSPEDDEDDGPALLGQAARALTNISPVVEIVIENQGGRWYGSPPDGPVEQLVAYGVLSLLRIAAVLQQASA